MKSAICTLFEGSYHYGVAALVNSLYSQGFRGQFYAGYRGALPAWAATASNQPDLQWPGSCTLAFAEGLKIHFLPLDTDYHFSNYKPDFMLRLWNGIAGEAEAMYYFDPDIVVTAPWSVFEEWVGYGAALCEDVNSPMAEHHPTRAAWRHYFGGAAIPLRFKEATYANGGFVGVHKKNGDFLERWQAIQEAMGPAIGGLGNSFLVTAPVSSPFAAFAIPDQDALNAAVEAWDGAVSFVNKIGMAFKAGKPLMSHAVGKQKPWLWQPLKRVMYGQPPRRADRDYWEFANGLILSQPAGLIKRWRLAIKVAALVGRFYSQR